MCIYGVTRKRRKEQQKEETHMRKLIRKNDEIKGVY